MKLKKPTESQTPSPESFITGADYAAHPTTENAYPWQGLDNKKTKAFNLRLPLDVYAKLQYLGENLPRTSMNNICLDALEPYIEAKLAELLQK